VSSTANISAAMALALGPAPFALRRALDLFEASRQARVASGPSGALARWT